MENLLHKMRIAQSVQQNIPYAAGILRSGDMRYAKSGKGGFAIPPELISAGMPLITDILKRPVNALITNPINKLFDWLGMGEGGAAYRQGGFWHRPGDLGISIMPVHDPRFSAMGQGEGLSKRDMKNLRVLETRLMPLAGDQNKFMNKLQKIHAAGEGYFRKHRKRMKNSMKKGKGEGSNIKKYKASKRYRSKKAKHYTKYPKAEYGKYRSHKRYKQHKAKYLKHFQKKRMLI